MDINLYQIFYSENQLPEIQPPGIPFFNEETPLSKVFHETGVFINEFIANPVKDSEIRGYLSWRFKQKTGIPLSSFHEFILKNPGYSVYFINPFPELVTLYSSVWQQGERWHPGIIQYTEELLSRSGISVGLKNILNNEDTALYCNYWAGNSDFWKKYMAFIKPVADTVIADLQKKTDQKYLSDSGYHTGVNYVTFIFERLFSTYLAADSSVKKINYEFSEHEMALILSNLRGSHEELNAFRSQQNRPAESSGLKNYIKKVIGR
jgi:hypothetical protein